MADRIYRLNLYTPADFEAQIRTFEAMARKGWQLEKYGPHLLTYRRTEPQETHYAMTFLSDEPPKGVIASSRQILLNRAARIGWELIYDDAKRPLQVLRSNRLSPPPVESDPNLYREQIAAMLNRQTYFPLSPLISLTLLWFVRYSLSPTSPEIICLLLLAILDLIFLWGDLLWSFLWKRRSKKAGRALPFYCTGMRTTYRLILTIVSFVTLYFLCTGPGAMRAISYIVLTLLFASAVHFSEQFVRRYIPDRKTEVRLLFLLVIIFLFLTGVRMIDRMTFPDDLPLR